MAKNLVNKVGETEADNLIAGVYPRALTKAIKLRKLASGTPVVIERGTIIAISSVDGLGVVLGTQAAQSEVLTPSYILVEDTEVTTAADVPAVAYRSGNFNPKKVIVAEDYTITAADKDALRKYSIIFTQMFED